MVVDPRMSLKLKTIPCAWNQRINCNLFGKMVEQIVPHLQNNVPEPLIVILQYFKVSRWNVTAFRERLVDDGSRLSGRISQLDSDGAFNGADEIVKGKANVQTIRGGLRSNKGVVN
ncbi:hypothetical protein PIB30_055681 [Stylosanthes scabra]|uniref:Uncharacterized protein n=1 Tax=Stylosanthes scabra TaxID=79078 RepID=A0ABU6QJW0_9FABA|nr:hypothetical protein [Stylosanthes scabra]